MSQIPSRPASLSTPSSAPAIADRPMPHTSGSRLFLFAMRRMASAGVNDAHAANALLGNFGKSWNSHACLTARFWSRRAAAIA